MSDEPLKPLDDEQVETVAGGYIFDASVLEKDRFRPWEVLDSKGNFIERFEKREEAVKYAPLFYGESATELTWKEVQKLRETGDPY